MTPVFLADDPALDFFNTAFVNPTDGTPVEVIGEGGALLSWLNEAGWIDDSTARRLRREAGDEALDALAVEIRKLRVWASDWVARWREAPTADYSKEIRRLNRVLAHGSSYRELVSGSTGFEVRDLNRVASPSDLLPLIASRIASLLSREDPALVKCCAGTDCVLWFVDRTKAHRRAFCSASACGNRAKVAAFRARRREATGG